MRRDKLFGNMFMRLSACTVMVFVFAGSVWGQGVAMRPRINPLWMRWQKNKTNTDKVLSDTNATKGAKGAQRLLTSSTEEETHITGEEPTFLDYDYLSLINTSGDRGVDGDNFDEVHDPRLSGGVTPVRNQGQWGTCWAHTSLASIETWLIQNIGISEDLSEKNLANLHGFDTPVDMIHGGNASKAAAYLLRWNGPVKEESDPYPSYPYNPGSVNQPPAYHIQQYRMIAGKTRPLDHDHIKRAIIKFGGLYTSFHIVQKAPYLNYRTGAYYYNGTEQGGHAVTLVGWDDNYSKKNFGIEPPGDGAYIAKNSWGDDWGDSGYIYVSYYDTDFACRTMYAFPSAESPDNYSSVYQYDTFGRIGDYAFSAGDGRVYISAYGANMFTAREDEEIAAVGFYANAPYTTYEIKVYANCKDASNPTKGDLAAEKSGAIDEFSGFYTIPLDITVPVSQHSRFAIVIRLKTPQYGGPLAYEAMGYKYDGQYVYLASEATASQRQSFLSYDGVSWYDFTEYVDPTANFCCKAYTKSARPPKHSLLSITVQPEDDKTMSLKPGDKVQMKCEATYSNNAKSNVTDVAQWSLTSGRSYATLSSGGLLTAKNVTVLEPQTITVQAVYAEDGIIATNRYGFSMAETPPEAPTDVTATQGTDTSCIHVNWTAPAGATEYAVYRAAVNNIKNVYHLENVNVAKYHDTGSVKPIVPGVDYWYFIKAKNSSGTSGFSAGMLGWRKLSPPDAETIKASDNLTDRVTISWGEVEGATHYRVYRADDVDGEKQAISGWLIARTFDDVPPEKDVPYCYYVVAAVDASGNRPSDYSIVEDGMMVSPVTVDHLEIKGDASIASGGYADYTADAIYTDSHRVENVSPVTLTVSGDGATVSGNRVTAATVTENKKVVLLASYTENGKIAPGEKEITIAAVKPNTPTGVTAGLVSQGVTITWDAVSGAVSYKVYRADSANAVATQIGMTAGTSYPDTSAMPGVAYAYSVSAVNGAGESERSGGVVVTVPLAAPTGVTATSDRTDGVNVKWSAVNGATHYRVARATSPTGAKTQLGSWQAGTAYPDASATAGTTYYYFVRAATSSGGANASEYSSPAAPGMRIPSRTLLSVEISGMDKVPASKSAVYTCVATYNDETTETVTPTWSVSPTSAATINENGLLMANAVMSDTKVTVTASYGGKTDTMEVTIVAPASASASVSNVRVKPRWPFGPLVDIDYTLTTSPEGTFALVSLSGLDNDHNLPLAARTLTGEGASGVVAAGERRITWDIGADYPNLHVKSLDVVLDAMPCVISAPANMSASQGTSTRGVNLSWSAVDDASGYEIWRAGGSMDPAMATLLTTVENVVSYEDTSANPGDVYFYWLKTVTPYGTGNFGISVFGYRARVVVNVSFDGNGGTPSSEAISGIAGNAYGTLPTASWMGYSFAGWYTAVMGGAQVTASSLFDENVTRLYAHWTANTYMVTLDMRGGSGGTSSVAAMYGSAMPSISVPTRESHIFDGYWSAPNGEGVQYYTASGASAHTWDKTGATTLYAKWIPSTYVVTLDFQGGSGGTSSVTAMYGCAMPSISMPTFENAVFGGYWTAPNGGGVQYYTASGASARTYDTTSAIKLYALWLTAPEDVVATRLGGEVGYSCASGEYTVPVRGGDIYGDGIQLTNYVRVSWSAVQGANNYQVYRSYTNDINCAQCIANTDELTYCDTSIPSDVLFYYWVRAVKVSNGVILAQGQFSEYSSGFRILVPSTVFYRDSADTIYLRPIAGAEKVTYNIHVKVDGTMAPRTAFVVVFDKATGKWELTDRFLGNYSLSFNEDGLMVLRTTGTNVSYGWQLHNLSVFTGNSIYSTLP